MKQSVDRSAVGTVVALAAAASACAAATVIGRVVGRRLPGRAAARSTSSRSWNRPRSRWPTKTGTAASACCAPRYKAATTTGTWCRSNREELLLGCEEGLFEKLDWAKLGGKDKYLPDAVSDCGVGAIVYSFVLAYDGDKIKDDAPKTWADFWNTQKCPGKRALRKGPKTTLEIALMADGVAPQDVYKMLAHADGVDRAFKKLDQLKPNLVWWEKGSQPPQLLAAGEVGDDRRLQRPHRRRERRRTRRTSRSSGPTTSTRSTRWVIMKGSRTRRSAEKFLVFVNDPQNQKNLPPKIAYGVTAKAATALIDPKVLREPALRRRRTSRRSLYISDKFWLENLDKLNQRFNAWVAK